MKAVQIYGYGDVNVLVYETAQRPHPEDDEVLIRVYTTTVNPFDCGVRAGYMAGWYTYSFPFILGLDVAGVVEEVGTGVTTFAPGDPVYTRTEPNRGGAYAEYVRVRATDVVAKPRTLDYIQAAALPHVALTAWEALIEAAQIGAGQKILIHRAAGGVGHIAVQLAKWRGAQVIGTASPQNVDYLRELGVDEVVDYTTTSFESVVHDVDIVLDTLGGDIQQRSWSVLKPGGLLISIIHPPSAEAAAAHGVRQLFVASYQTKAEVLTQIAALAETGILKPTVSTILPLYEVKRAHELSQSNHTRGKIVLQVMEDLQVVASGAMAGAAMI
jgi:NADPH:quinone reductase-like Zn-dependent oxidoreductase